MTDWALNFHRFVIRYFLYKLWYTKLGLWTIGLLFTKSVQWLQCHEISLLVKISEKSGGVIWKSSDFWNITNLLFWPNLTMSHAWFLHGLKVTSFKTKFPPAWSSACPACRSPLPPARRNGLRPPFVWWRASVVSIPHKRHCHADNKCQSNRQGWQIESEDLHGQ